MTGPQLATCAVFRHRWAPRVWLPSTGTSTTAMLVCSARHMADVLPLLGLSGAAIFLDPHKTPLLWRGILMNLVGIGYLMLHLRRQAPGNTGISPAQHSHLHGRIETT